MDARLRGPSVIIKHWRWPVIATLVLLQPPTACRKEAPPPPREGMLDVGQVTGRLAGLTFDDAFFKDLETLKGIAARPDADPTVQDAAIRFDLDALAAGLATTARWLPRVVGGDPGEASLIADFLKGVANRAASRDKDLAHDLQALAGAFDRSAVMDLTPALKRVEGDTPLAPALRLVMAWRLLDAVQDVMGAPETERGSLVMNSIPGWPNPPTSDPMKTAFPQALECLSRWLALGEGPEKGLAPHYSKMREHTAALLQSYVFPIPVVPEANARPQSPGVFPSLYFPLVVATLKGDDLRVGLRPVLAWREGKAVNLAGDKVFPGEVVASGEALERVTVPVFETVGARLRQAVEAAAPLEEKAYPQADKARNAGRKDRGLALLWAVEGTQPTRRVETALALAERAGFTDVRLIQPGSAFQVAPVFFRAVPKVPQTQGPKGAKVLVALGKDSVEVYPPAGGARCKTPTDGWPEGVRVLKTGGAVTGLQVGWDEQGGFKGALTRLLNRWFTGSEVGCAVSPAVPVIVRSGDLPAAMLIDAAAEILAVSGPVFSKTMDYFPGLVCGDGMPYPGAPPPCPAAIPVLFAGDRVPKPTRTEAAAVEVSRPAGFCDQKDVARVMGGRAGAVRACYEMHLQRNPELAGRLEVRFTIEEDGTISGLTVTQNELGQEVAACVLRQISSLKFPKPAGGVCVIRWPYRFKPGG